jgi:ribonucleoside-triphosphate reductase
MTTLIIKRDGTKVPFQKEKIVNAITKAFYAVDNEVTEYAQSKAENIADYIEKNINVNNSTVEEIQDLVEHGLMATKRKDVARAYISYRNERTREREKNSTIRKIVKEKMSAKNVQNQNANVDEKSFGGRMGEANSAIMRQLALDEYVTEKTRYNHINNRVYVHDLDHWVAGDHNCLSIPFDDLLANGFNTRQTDVRPAKSINTAFQLLAVIFQLQSLQQFG